jgi:hypothetical protein
MSARYDVLKQYFFLENLAYSRILQSFLQKLEVRRNLNIDTLQEVRSVFNRDGSGHDETPSKKVLTV